MLAMVFDTETSDMVNFNEPYDDDSQPWPVEIAWQLINLDNWGVSQSYVGIVAAPPLGEVAAGALKIHGITAELCRTRGVNARAIFHLFAETFKRADIAVCHSWNYDRRVMATMSHLVGAKEGWPAALKEKRHICTMMSSTAACKIPGKRGGYKWPTLKEAYEHFTGATFEDSHTAMADVKATVHVLRGLVEGGHVAVELAEARDARKD